MRDTDGPNGARASRRTGPIHRTSGRADRVDRRSVANGSGFILGGLLILSLPALMFGISPEAVSAHSHFGPASLPALGVALATPAASDSPIPALQLGVSVAPTHICAFQSGSCPAGTGTARVTLTANAAGGGVVAWPAVQVAFVLETTPYDGVYDGGANGGASDPCASGGAIPCEESNGVPFFVKNAQLIASEIQSANPHSKVSFALVDYFATLTDHDDGDGSEYHVDIQDFVPASEFGAAVASTFQAEVLLGGWYYSDSDFSDNILVSSSITALYGTIIGSGLTWTNNTHHVIVWIGSTVPRDPSYQVDYSAFSGYYNGSSPDLSASCEPSYSFTYGASPPCEGWIRSQDGVPTHSIARLAQSAPACSGSIGGLCTVDTLDLWTTPTDPFSDGWPAGGAGGGPGGVKVINDVDRVIAAGCDLAAATGGTWDGPAGFVCPNGQAGTLQYVPHGSYSNPNTGNPTLLSAFRDIGFGPVSRSEVAAGTDAPLFTFVPIGNIQLPPAAQIQAVASCYHGGLGFRTCQVGATVEQIGGLTYLGFNWSVDRSTNVMHAGDSWTASFNVIALGPPYALVPVDACTTATCRAGGSGEVDGFYTAATYVPSANNSLMKSSFPLGTIAVEASPTLPLPPQAPPPPPPAPPPFATPSTQPLPLLQTVGIGSTGGAVAASLQAAAAGLLGAGFLRMSMKNRPMAIKVAVRSGAPASRFSDGFEERSGRLGPHE